MPSWFPYALAAAALYGAHQVFTRMAADRIGDGLGSLVVEATATLTILVYLAMLAAGRGDRSGLNASTVRLRATAEKGHAAAPVALHWNAALGALMVGDTAAAKNELRACRAESVRLGGSHAQRTVVDQTQAWIEAA